MNNDKAFAVYALLVIGAVFSLLTTILLSAGEGFPPFSNLLEHVAMGLGIRAAYKSIGGWNWADWSIAGDAVAEPVEEALPARKAA